jgi:hypothetical protein
LESPDWRLRKHFAQLNLIIGAQYGKLTVLKQINFDHTPKRSSLISQSPSHPQQLGLLMGI